MTDEQISILNKCKQEYAHALMTEDERIEYFLSILDELQDTDVASELKSELGLTD